MNEWMNVFLNEWWIQESMFEKWGINNEWCIVNWITPFLEDKISKRIEFERVNYFWLNV